MQISAIVDGVFQSTLPHGERPGRSIRFLRSGYFNPRSRMGSDDLRPPEESVKAISIHAPAWGATGQRPGISGRHQDFNPRSRMGSDVPVYDREDDDSEFQSTLPHGERPTPTPGRT